MNQAIATDEEAVVVLGAGSSADFGVPTLKGVFKDFAARRYLTKNAELDDFLSEYAWKLRGVNADSSDRSLNIEEILTLLRDWEFDKSLGVDIDSDTITAVRRHVYQLLFRAVFMYKDTRKRLFNDLIICLEKTFRKVTWATFNWDCIFEASYWYTKGQNPQLIVDLENWIESNARSTLLKLHGSVNWWDLPGGLTYFRWGGGQKSELEDQWARYRADSKFRPVILEPSSYKYQDECYKLLAIQWDEFLAALKRASIVLVVGYSLPESDSRARTMMLTGFQFGPGNWGVVDPGGEIISRYSRLFGEQHLSTRQETLSSFTSNLKQNLEDLFPAYNFYLPWFCTLQILNLEGTSQVTSEFEQIARLRARRHAEFVAPRSDRGVVVVDKPRTEGANLRSVRDQRRAAIHVRRIRIRRKIRIRCFARAFRLNFHFRIAVHGKGQPNGE